MPSLKTPKQNNTKPDWLADRMRVKLHSVHPFFLFPCSLTWNEKATVEKFSFRPTKKAAGTTAKTCRFAIMGSWVCRILLLFQRGLIKHLEVATDFSKHWYIYGIWKVSFQNNTELFEDLYALECKSSLYQDAKPCSFLSLVVMLPLWCLHVSMW